MAEQHQDHIDRITELSRPGAALAADAPTATVNNAAWFRSVPGDSVRTPRAQRHALHDRFVQAARDQTPGVQQNKQAIVLAGPPGAGKSTVLSQILGDDQGSYLVIDADKFKVFLLEHAQRDGSYEGSIKPVAVKELERDEGYHFYPLELASLVHEESSMLAKRLRVESVQRGDNIVVDSVLSNAEEARKLGRSLEDASYEIQVVDVEVDFAISRDRIKARWQRARQEAEQTGDGLGGRWVPSEYARGVFSGPEGESKPQHAAAELARSCTAVTRYRVYRTTAEQANENTATPVLESEMTRPQLGVRQLLDTGDRIIRTDHPVSTDQSDHLLDETTPRSSR